MSMLAMLKAFNPMKAAGSMMSMGGLKKAGNPLTYDTPQTGYADRPGAQQAQFVSAGGSKVGRDQGGEQAQRDALQRMRGIADTGYSDIDRAAMASAQKNQKAANKTAQESVLRNAQRRGSSASSGGDLSAALIEGQGSADRLAEDTRQINAQGQERRTQATGAMNDIGGQLTGQQMAIGQAQNQMNQFNAQQQNQMNSGNAQLGTMADGQRYQGQNTYFQNQAQMQQATNAANTGYNQQMFGQFTQPFFKAYGAKAGKAMG